MNIKTISKLEEQYYIITNKKISPITKEIIKCMTDEEFNSYYEEISKIKPYLERYLRYTMNTENFLHKIDDDFERWLKMEIRNEKLREFGI